jgi:hypothetical protein
MVGKHPGGIWRNRSFARIGLIAKAEDGFALLTGIRAPENDPGQELRDTIGKTAL